MTLTESSAATTTGSGALSIEMIDVSKRYGDTTAVDVVNLKVTGGQFVVLLGPSGCGKTTLLRLISGLETITSGELYLDDELANYMRPRQRNVAMVFQNYALYPHMTVEENIAFPLTTGKRPRGRRARSEIADQVREVAGFVDLGEQLKRFPDQLSGGQRQRVALARAIIRHPGAFLMDEPLSNLDALLRVQMRTELLKLHRRIGLTFVYVTHDQTEAMTMADVIVVMRSGVVQQIGTPDELYKEPANTFVATFIGSPQMNLIEGTVTQRDGLPFFESALPLTVGTTLPTALPAGKLTVGARPEDILLCSPTDPGAIPGRVDIVETVGPDSYLNISVAGSQTVTMRVPVDDRVHEGASVNIRFRPDRVRLFDQNGKALTS